MLLAALITCLPLISNAQEIVDQLPFSENSIQALTETSISQFQINLDHYLTIPNEERTFDNTVRFWDFLNGEIQQNFRRVYIMLEIHPEKQIRNFADLAVQKIDQTILNALAEHPEIYNACLQVENNDLNEQERYLLNQLLIKFRLRGMQLPDKERSLFAQTNQEINALKSLFNRQVAEDSPILYATKEELAGLEENWFSSKNQNEQGAYKLTCDLPTYTQILSNCSVRKTRKAIYELFTNRAFPQNEEVAIQLIEKRKQLAKLAGFPSYSAYELSSQMVGSPERAQIFLKEIKKKAAIKAAKEFALVIKNLPESVSLTPSGQLEGFDELYVFENYRKQHFSIDQNLIAEYFPMDKTIQGLIKIYEIFFGLSIQEAPHSIVIPDLKTLEIRNSAGHLLGMVVLDLFPREGKCAHSGVCFPILLPYSPPEGPDYPALSLIVGNFTKAMKERPPLMKHSEVVTFFHEFGHAIHNILGRNEFFSLCGMSVKWDFVEVPSRLLENWIWDTAILKQLSSHYISGESLSDELIQNMIQARDFGLGTLIQKMCFQSELSLAFFGEKEIRNPTELMRQIWKQELPHTSLDKNNHFHASWWHFSNYGPKYYSYLWSEVFACEIFEKIREGGLLNPKMGAAYIKAILGKGGSQDPEQMVIDFLGRKPSTARFLKQLDL